MKLLYFDHRTSGAWPAMTTANHRQRDHRLFGFMNRRLLARVLVTLLTAASSLLPLPARAADDSADTLIKRLFTEVLDSIKSDKLVHAADTSRITALVDAKIMPNVNFQRMTASAVGPAWRLATPTQKQRLEEEFKILLVRTYTGALAQVSDQTIDVEPVRAAADDKDVVVRTEVKGRGDPIQLDYRLEKTAGEGAGWKIYNLNIMGVWLVETYRGQFAQEINGKGIDGLITTLTDRNKVSAKK
jgi:phospholipid transport system substrate-binding protein